MNGALQQPGHARPRKIGKLTEPVYLNILEFVPIPDLPQFALASRKFSQLVRDDSVWKAKLRWLNYKGPGQMDWASTSNPPQSAAATAPPRKPDAVTETSSDDDFGDFFDGDAREEAVSDTDDGFGDFQDGEADLAPQGARDASVELFSISDGFDDAVKLENSDAARSRKTPKAPDDLLLMFDDEDDDDLVAPPPQSTPAAGKPFKRPPAVSNLTFATQPVLPSPPTSAHSTASSSRPSAFAFNPSNPSPTSPHAPSSQEQHDYISTFKAYHATLLPYYLSLVTHTTSSLVFTTPSLSPMMRARLLSTLSRFCHPLLAPTRSLPQRLTVLRNVQSAMDFFESALVAEFERADTSKDEDSMRDKAKVLWELNEGNSLREIFVQKREEVFFEREFNPLRNLT